MIRYVIIDDEPIAHGIIEGFADSMHHLQKTGNCYDAFEAIKLLQEQQVDLLFLDINMPKLSGFEFLKTLSNPPKVIITSAYKEFALDGYEFDVVDYLLKPFSIERFIKAVNKIKPLNFNSTNTQETHFQQQQLFIKSDKRLHQIYVNDILYIEAYGNYCKVHLEDELIVTLQKISDFETQLSSNFIRVHKSFIVSKQKIKSVEGNSIHLKDKQIPIGQTYKSVIKTIFK
ncbi:LytR/AlgR family response regulator transcription factor [Winogradskyella immobilis]|uniref:Response regulator transcription factor n=1 Tax=Winogradskyella immobilis TaxID=2816852 RepID=A0ABS8EK04_9FLAO|nr:LytTR family DNA-binding domain-containing protein [Winogradskyella immobilis]MCC1483528.1 response regulator transcription factor [Winogradskyella immobilis]MCG0015622.1 LytTR family DNA-binding domain-containing protein [Winogradskyella immobilis]